MTALRPPGRLSWALGLLLLHAAASAADREDAARPARPNVLFIAVDDLNHWVGHLGRNPQAKTPHIDRLAARGVAFTRAYCAAPLCNPSRAALLSGLRPGSTGVYGNASDWRTQVAEGLTLPALLRSHGYYTAAAGKIYHGGFNRPSDWDALMRGSGEEGGDGGGGASAKRGGVSGGVGALKWSRLEAGDEEMQDHRTVSWCARELEKKHEKPFFLACGLVRPHLPWAVPKKYFDLHPLESIELPPFKEDDLDDLPPAGVRMAAPAGDHAAIAKAGLWKEAVQAYLASISFADQQVGRLLDALDRSPHRNSTIIVFFGDHGWHLGEKRHWRKFALWEEATRAPFIWAAPGVTTAGGRCEHPVDFMSIYPTLAELCGVPAPSHVQGPSIVPLLRDPKAEWKLPAITTHGLQNHAVRTEKWRYIRYADGGEELYDEARDPYEWTNLARDPGHEEVKRQLAEWLPKENRPEAGGGEARPRRKQKAKEKKAE
jgi:arylsulfatase A-like enzyme